MLLQLGPFLFHLEYTEDDNNNELSDKQENSNLIETIKQTLVEDYRQTSTN
jgi:hypothetical protein